MTILIILLVILAAVIIYNACSSSKATKRNANVYDHDNNATNRKNEVIERRKVFVESKWPDARIVVNDGVHLFFKDDAHHFFGCDESEKIYRFEDLLSIHNFKTVK